MAIDIVADSVEFEACAPSISPLSPTCKKSEAAYNDQLKSHLTFVRMSSHVNIAQLHNVKGISESILIPRNVE